MVNAVNPGLSPRSAEPPRLSLTRYAGNPILIPNGHWWETGAVLNAAATRAFGQVHILYRAVGEDNISRLGHAVSEDGFHFQRFANPIFEGDPNNEYERMGVEDPRITQIGDTYYMLYTAASHYPPEEAEERLASGKSPYGVFCVRVSMASTKDFVSFQRHGVIINDCDTKNAILFPEKIGGRYVMIHRIHPRMIMAQSDNLRDWTDTGVLMGPQPGLWDEGWIGAGAQPIKSEKGWLLFYHGVRNFVYSLGLVVLDLEDPSKILYRSQEPILTPQTAYELAGVVNKVVFTCGAVEMDGKYFVYYGAADKVIGVATVEVDEVLKAIETRWNVRTSRRSRH